MATTLGKIVSAISINPQPSTTPLHQGNNPVGICLLKIKNRNNNSLQSKLFRVKLFRKKTFAIFTYCTRSCVMEMFDQNNVHGRKS